MVFHGHPDSTLNYSLTDLVRFGRTLLARQPGGPRTGGSPLASRGVGPQGQPAVPGGWQKGRTSRPWPGGGFWGLPGGPGGPWGPQVPGLAPGNRGGPARGVDVKPRTRRCPGPRGPCPGRWPRPPGRPPPPGAGLVLDQDPGIGIRDLVRDPPGPRGPGNRARRDLPRPLEGGQRG